MDRKKITLVSANLNKVKEFKEILKDNFEIENEKINLNEIQSMSVNEISEFKVKEAFNILKKPVLVEDTGFFIDELNGLPGPFIKFFEEKLGVGACIKLLGTSKNRKAKQICVVAYYDGINLFLEEAELEGEIAYDVKNGEGFGFDFCFIPKGYNKTFSELGFDQKNKISARKKAIEKIRLKLDFL